MQKSITLFLITFFFVGSLFAQNEPYNKSLAGYFSYASKDFGITCKMPKKSSDLNQYFSAVRVRENQTSGFIYGPIFQTKDKKCIVMYPAILLYYSRKSIEDDKKLAIVNRLLKNDTSTAEPKVGTNHTFPRSQVTGELKAAIGLFDYFGQPLHDSVSFDFNEHVTVIAGKRAKEMFNADSIYIYDLPLEEPYQGKYAHRTGMVISKRDRATMIFKLFFTAKGKKKEDEFIEMLSKQIWYEEDFSHQDE